ncbi:MAG: hypothetical protein MAG453_00613 [Calditrichaeota bacterium]|nr:hypothetical protein [Calditrichota bacterium]
MRAVGFAVTFVLCATLVIPAVAGEAIGVDIKPEKDPFDDRDEPWRWTFAPAGEVWVWQHTRTDPLVTWDFGATLLAQFGRGNGHAVWFGGAYREAAGFDEGATITPFNPRHIDSAQFLTWRYQLARRSTLFTHWERWCYHEIDVYNRSAVFFTHAGFGYGTLSPAEAWGQGPRRAQLEERPVLDYYLLAGPMIHGGPVEIMGNWPRWQGQADAWSALAAPVVGVIVVELRVKWSLLLLRESEDARWRHRGDIRLSVMGQRDSGNIYLAFGYRVRDDYPYRRNPEAPYIAFGYRI